jgi:hypothetical protein
MKVRELRKHLKRVDQEGYVQIQIHDTVLGEDNYNFTVDIFDDTLMLCPIEHAPHTPNTAEPFEVYLMIRHLEIRQDCPSNVKVLWEYAQVLADRFKFDTSIDRLSWLRQQYLGEVVDVQFESKNWHAEKVGSFVSWAYDKLNIVINDECLNNGFDTFTESTR